MLIQAYCNTIDDVSIKSLYYTVPRQVIAKSGAIHKLVIYNNKKYKMST